MHNSFFKQEIYVSDKYRDWVRQLPCGVTGRNGPSDPHHVKIKGFTTGSKKTHDWLTIPLNHELHVEGHAIGWLSWEEKWGRNAG